MPRRWTLRTALFGIAAVAVLLAILTTLPPPGTNCGGNSAALWSVHQYSLIVQQAAQRRPSHEFTIAEATHEEREELIHVASPYMLSRGRFLVSSLPYREGVREPRRVLIVCDTPYTNVPRRLFPAPPTHAVAFSDGSVALMSVAEYAALNRSLLVPLNELLAAAIP